MTHNRRIILLFLLLIAFESSFLPSANAYQAKKLPNVVILATGGTIAGAAATGTQAAYTSGAVTIDAMVRRFLESGI
jgi:L-asparaginase